jgi:type IV pili sensor histidine kinase/response regulator
MKQKALMLLALLAAYFVPQSAFALDPMRIQIRTNFPAHLETVGQAAQYFARGIGYRLATDHPAPEESAQIATEAIGPLARSSQVMPIEEAILSLLRPNHHLVIDHQNKLFSFEKGESE